MTPPGKKRVRIRLEPVNTADPQSINDSVIAAFELAMRDQGISIVRADTDVSGADESRRVIVDEIRETMARPHIELELQQVQSDEQSRRRDAGIPEGNRYPKPPEEVVAQIIETKGVVHKYFGTFIYASVRAVLDFVNDLAKGG